MTDLAAPLIHTGPRNIGPRARRRPAVAVPRLLRCLDRRELRTLWLAQLTSELGDWSARVALAVLIYARTQSAVATGLVVTVSLMPNAVLGVVTSAVADRYPRRRVLVGADLMRAAIFGLFALPSIPIVVLLVGALIAGAATPPFEAARSAMRADMIRDDDAYGSFTALTMMTSQSAVAFGYLFGGGLTFLIGTHATLGLNAASFAISALLVSRLPTGGGAGGVGGGICVTVGLRQHVSAGARAMWSDVWLRRCLALGAVSGLVATLPESLAPVYERGSAMHSGMLLAVGPAALILCSAVIPTSGGDARLIRTACTILVGAAGVALAGFVLSSSFVVAVAAWAAAGLAFAVIVPAGPVLRRHLPAEGRAVAFAIVQSSLMGSCCLTALLGGLAASRFGVPATCAGGCVLGLLAGGYLLAVTR